MLLYNDKVIARETVVEVGGELDSPIHCVLYEHNVMWFVDIYVCIESFTRSTKAHHPVPFSDNSFFSDNILATTALLGALGR